MSDKTKSQKGRVAGLIIVIVLYLALACVFTRPMLTQGNHATYKDPYDPTFEAWTLAWDIKELKSNPLNLFNANIYYPNQYTLAYSDHQLTTAIMAMPVLAITGNPIQTANLMLIFNFFLGALGAYLLTNHLTRNRAAAFIAGVIFAFGAPRLSHMGHLQLSTACWIPLCLLFLHKYSEDGGWANAALVGLFLVLQTLATWYYGIILSVGILVFLVVRLVTNHKGFTLRWTLTLVIALLVAGALIMPFAIPYLKVQKRDPKFVRTIQEVDLFSADVRDFAVASDTNWLWGNLTSGLRQTTMSRGGPTERSLFPGLLPLVLGVIGAVYLFMRGKGDERFYVRFYVTLAAVSAVLCLGSRLYFFGHSVDIPMPYDLLYYAFPGFKVIRVPPRFIILVLLALGVLSAFAVRAIVTRIAARKNVGLSVVALVAVIGLLMLDLMSISLPMYDVAVNGQIPKVYSWLKEQPGETPTVEMPLANYNPRTFKDGLQYEETWLEREPLRTYYSTQHWKKILNGYSGFIPTSYYNAVKATADFPSRASIAYLKKQGIKYVIVHGKQYDPATLQKIFDYSLKNKDLQPWKVFGTDYVYRIR
jgi:hypothetical protein